MVAKFWHSLWSTNIGEGTQTPCSLLFQRFKVKKLLIACHFVFCFLNSLVGQSLDLVTHSFCLVFALIQTNFISLTLVLFLNKFFAFL